jgi:hypothetical protein
MGKKMKETHVWPWRIWLYDCPRLHWLNDAMIHWCKQAY